LTRYRESRPMEPHQNGILLCSSHMIICVNLQCPASFPVNNKCCWKFGLNSELFSWEKYQNIATFNPLKSTSVPLPRGSEPKSTGKSLQYILDHNLPQISGRLHFQTHQYIQIVDRMSRFISPLWCFFLQRRHDPLYPYDLPITPISYGESPRSSSRFPWRCLDPNRWWTSQKAGDYSPKDMATKKTSTKPTTKEFKKISLPPQSSGPFAPWAHARACGRWAPLQVSKSSSGNDSQWIGLRENLQETMDFTIKYRAFL